MTHVQILTVIIVGAGFLAGLTNFFLEFKLDYKKKECWINLMKYVLLSLCASITVPLFLQILSNNLIDEPATGTLPSKNYFIFAGFCVLASFFSRRFLDDLYNKLKHLQQKTDENSKKIDDNVKKTNDVDRKVEDLEETMEDTVPTDIKNVLTSNQELLLGNNDVQKLINALYKSKYAFRTIQGIGSETQLSDDQIQKVLNFLLSMGFAERRVSYKGDDLWRLLKYPIKIYSASYGIPGSLIDVTTQIQNMVSKEIYDGKVLPSTFSVSDPAPYLAKTLKIHCRIKGTEKELSFVDGETFRIG